MIILRAGTYWGLTRRSLYGCGTCPYRQRIESNGIDNVIYYGGGYYSFAEQNEMTELPKKQIMQVNMEMNTNSFQRIKMSKKINRRVV